MTLPALDGIPEKLQALLTYDASSPLIFSSGLFLFLFAGFMLVYSMFRRAPMARIVYVILFSLYFYYKSSGIYFLLLIFAATSDYWIAKGIHAARSTRAKRWLVVLSVAVNLGMLAYFKYTNFLIDIANQMFGQGFMQFQNIFLPVGISFFVFQSMSYTIDIYRGQLKPLDNWCDYLFYLSFFPQLVAGPIVRARDFIPQIRQNPIVVTREMFGTGVFLILTGLFKKAIISDYISLNFVDRIFDEPLLYSGFECLAGIYGYALQIYCDFSGYSDMAIGIALLLGFRFPKNFDAPYKSATITEFWRRWHISLSTWLRDYLYISLGGNRKGKLRTYGNLFITMLLGGLWHGAAVRFILWGALHGAALALHKLWMAVVPGAKATGDQMHWWSRAAGIFFTFNLVCLGWLMFRAESMQTVELMLHQIFYNFNAAMIPQVVSGYAGAFALIAAGFLLHLMPGRADRFAQRLVSHAPLVLQIVMAAAMIWCVMQVKSSDIQPFIYFQFSTAYDGRLVSRHVPPTAAGRVCKSGPAPRRGFRQCAQNGLRPFTTNPLTHVYLRPRPFLGPQFRRRHRYGPRDAHRFGHRHVAPALRPDPLAGMAAQRLARHADLHGADAGGDRTRGHGVGHLQEQRSAGRPAP